ncbi:MAG: NTPase [Desulfobacteraceae bacterium]|nr:NTPase [Desulfobacteraceae bacterium]
MDPKDIHRFSSDRPIEKVEDDLLDRAGFSKDIADALAGWHEKDSLVVALHGNWGSGKSSIKNMAISELKKLKKNKPEIIEFAPWEWAAQEKITASFFQEISATIGRKDKSKDGKKLAASLKKYGRYLNTGESIATGFSTALPALFIFAAILGIGNNFLDENWVKNLTSVLLGLTVVGAGILKWGKSFLNKISGNIEITAKENELSLIHLRNELTELLKKKENSLLVIMDDLDRLTSEQLRMVFQIVKANTEFPNVVFLLLFQRDLVEDKLDDGKQKGKDFLEKIIQIPFDIPKIEISLIHNLLFNKINRILEQDKFAVKMFDSMYWTNCFYRSLYVYFDNLRDVYRFSSTLSFHFNLFRGRSAFEVNPVDLIAIECLRVFEPDVYKAIARSKEFIIKNSPDRLSGTDDTILQAIEGITEKSTDGKKDYVSKLIMQIFPNIEWALGGKSYSYRFSDSWLREMRICHPSNFNKYFQLSILSGELSNSDLTEMLVLTSNRSDFSAYIVSLKERGILMNALFQFGSYIDKIPIENAIPFIQACLDNGDEVDHESVGVLTVSSNSHLVDFVIRFLERISSIEDRGQIILKCFTR